jgi:SAM dependent carboxyl methyltransferase
MVIALTPREMEQVRLSGDDEMSDALTPNHGVMEGNGAYNKRATGQASGGASAVPLLVQAAREIALDPGDQHIVIADYGSSQGKNSLAPIRAAIEVLRTRLGQDRPIDVVHTDLPANDFSTLFNVLDTDPDRYVLDQQNVFPYAIGKSFYRRLFPPGHVHLGWSSYAAVWLSRLPTMIPDHFFPTRSTSADRAKFDRQGAQDWKAFLSLRADELRRGGRLVIVLPGLDDGGKSEADGVLDHANSVLAEMVDEGAITTDEHRHMTLASYPRRERDLLLPFQQDGQFQDLVVEHCGMCVVADTAWANYQRCRDEEVLATEQALLFRATFIPSLAAALTSSRSAKEREAFGDRLEDKLKHRLARHPAPWHQRVQTIVLTKQAAACKSD